MVNFIATLNVLKYPITARRFQELPRRIQTTNPILLHHPVHDMTFHDLESIQMLQVIQWVAIHEVDWTELEFHLLREEKVVQDATCLGEYFVVEAACAELGHWVSVLYLI